MTRCTRRQIRSEILSDLRRLAWGRISVVNALSERLEVEVARGQLLYRQIFERGHPKTPSKSSAKCKTGAHECAFKPDEKIFGNGRAFQAVALVQMARAKAYLFGGSR